MTRVDRARQLSRILTLATFLVVAVGALILAKMLYAPLNPLSLYSITIPDTRISQGDLAYTVRFCKRTTQDATVNRGLQGADGTTLYYALPPVSSVIRPGCGTVTIPLMFPPGMRPGHYQLQEHVVFAVNPLRTVDIEAYSNVFTVRP